MPEVSVVIPAFNAARYLPAALESVLTQNVRDIEILVVDDGSTDDTEALLRRYDAPVRYLRQENQGVSVARNLGIQKSRGRFVGFLDADDTWLPGKLERQLEALRATPGVRACYGAFLMVDDALVVLAESQSPRHGTLLEDLLLHGNVVGSICTVLAERTLFDEVGGFDPTFSQCADWDMWIRLATRTDFAYVSEPLVTYRQHATNMSRNAALFESDSRSVLEKAFAQPELPPTLLRLRRRALGRNLFVLARSYFHARRPLSFLRCAGVALFMDPRQLGHLRTFPPRSLRRLFRVP
jgi:glycosyltransferase involved in cell wall biosynthesis